MKTQDWVEMSVLFDNDICPMISASVVSLSIIMLVPSHAEFSHINSLKRPEWLAIGTDMTRLLAEHTWSTGHHVDLSTAEVVDTQPFVTTQCLLESWHIQRHPDTLNRERGTLPREYTALLN